MISLPFTQALVIKPEWLHEIYCHNKRWEMRSTKTNKRGTYGFIAQGTGLITGQFDLVDCLAPLTLEEHSDYFDMHRIPAEKQDLLSNYRYPWVMKNVTKFDTPIKYSHPQGAVIWVNIDKNNIL